MKLGPQTIWKVFIFFKILFIAISIFIFSGCSLSGSIKSIGSQKDEAPANPITSPVTGSDELRLTEPTDYIKPSNQSAYPITGSCKTSGTLTVEVNNTVVKTDVSCTNETFSTTLDLTSITSGDVSIKVISNENTSTVSSVTIMKDTVAPSLIGTVIDGTYFNSTSTTPTLTWTAAADAHSGVAEYEIAIGTTAGGTDILNWTSTNSTTATHAQSGLTLIEGTQYFASLRAVDNAGNTSTSIQSDGWTVDATAPTLATSFTDGEINFSSTSSKVLNWVASTDAASGVSGYEVALGTTAGATDVMNWTSVGNVITETIDSLTLFGNRRYYASLRSVDVAGNRTASVMSDGWWNLRQSKLSLDNSNQTPRIFSFDVDLGQSVALSEDELTLVIGVPKDKLSVPDSSVDVAAGAVFVYTKSAGTWVFQQKIVATGTNSRGASDRFGYSVSISGETIVVGSPYQSYDTGGENLVSGAGAAYVFVRSSGLWTQQQKIVATGTNARVANDSFGWSVSISGETIAVGAFGQDYDASGENLASGAGAAFVYTRSSGVWTQQQKLIATGTNARLASNSFGHSISIDSDTIVVGAIGQSFDADGNTSISSAGAAYVYIRSAGVWSQQQKLVATGTNARVANDRFGESVAVNSDTIVVGAAYQDFNAGGTTSVSGAGAAYVYIRSAGVWTQQQKLVATGTNARVLNDRFGNSVSISGETIAVGSPYQSYDATGANLASYAGAVFIYTRSAGVWSQQQKIVSSGTNARVDYDHFGLVVSLQGETLAVGAPDHSYNSSGQFFVSSAGAAFSYTRVTSTWGSQQKIVDTSVPANRQELSLTGFGASIALSDDGNTLVIGAPIDPYDQNDENPTFNSSGYGMGSIYVFTQNSGTWSFQQKLIAFGVNSRLGGVSSTAFGRVFDISGDTIVVGDYVESYDADGNDPQSDSGLVYIYQRSGGVWSNAQRITPTSVNGRDWDGRFGISVAISGETIVVGAEEADCDTNGTNCLTDAGAAFVFVRSGGVWTQQQVLSPTGANSRAANDIFGSSVDIDGETIAVSSQQNDFDETGSNSLSNAGAVYVFTRSAGVWTQQQKIVASGLNARLTNTYFGRGLSLSGDTLAIEAGVDYDQNGENSVAGNSTIFIFTRSAGVWSQETRIVPQGLNARNTNDYFGYYGNFKLSGSTLVVGSYNHDYDENGVLGSTNAGAIFVYKKTSGQWQQEIKLVPQGANARIESALFGFNVALIEKSAGNGYLFVTTVGDQYDSNGQNPVSVKSIYSFD